MSRELDAILEELVAREPLFHHQELVDSADTFDLEVADDFWEVGASGRFYDRDTVKKNLLRRLADTAEDDTLVENWRTLDHKLRELGQDTYLLTYVLHGQSRATRRATIWRHDAEGTVVAAG